MDYIARFGIDHGITHGFGVKYGDYITREEKIIADDNAKAMIKATELARDFSENYLSNPDNDYTTVTLISLKSNGTELVDKEIIEKCSKLEHLLLSMARQIIVDE